MYLAVCSPVSGHVLNELYYMNITLSIDDAKCIKCGKCVRVCPSWIFKQSSAGGEVTLQYPETCIACGHCVAACPQSAVIHSVFPQEKVHPVDFESLPTPGQMMMLCQARRSNRTFSSAPVPVEMLEQILKAAHLAPTASNRQNVSFTLVTDPDKLRGISDFTIGVFSSIARKLANPVLKFVLKPMLPELYAYLPAFQRLVKEYDNGNDLILRKATAVIFIHTPQDSRFGCQDSNLAYQNGSLMAESLGVSQFYTGFVCSAIQQDKKNQLSGLLGIKGKIHAGMALGMPSFRYPNYIDRKEIEVDRI